jgi:branched-subunit amino acid aminotransferase/4-amino-4-deoxychorismate lyase
MAELDGVPVQLDQLQPLALYNYGHYTSIRVDNHRAHGLSLHLDRLVRDCRVLFNTDLDRDRVVQLVQHATSTLTGSYVVRVTGGGG